VSSARAVKALCERPLDWMRNKIHIPTAFAVEAQWKLRYIGGLNGTPYLPQGDATAHASLHADVDQVGESVGVLDEVAVQKGFDCLCPRRLNSRKSMQAPASPL
jgi:hypothetical protein